MTVATPPREEKDQQDEEFQPSPPGQLSERVNEYSRWGQELALADRYLGGEKLKDGGRLSCHPIPERRIVVFIVG